MKQFRCSLDHLDHSVCGRNVCLCLVTVKDSSGYSLQASSRVLFFFLLPSSPKCTGYCLVLTCSDISDLGCNIAMRVLDCTSDGWPPGYEEERRHCLDGRLKLTTLLTIVKQNPDLQMEPKALPETQPSVQPYHLDSRRSRCTGPCWSVVKNSEPQLYHRHG